MTRPLIFLLLVSLHAVIADVVYDVPLNTFEYEIIADHGYDRIVTRNGAYSVSSPGSPELPVIPFNYLLAPDEHLTSITVVEEVWEELPGTYVLFPRQTEQMIDEALVFTDPDTAVYGSHQPYPERVVPVSGVGNVRGYRLVYVGVVPFRYMAKAGTLYLLKRLVLRLHTALRRTSMYPRRETHLVRDMTERFISGLVVNKEIVRDQRMRPPTYVEDNCGDIAATELPSLLGAPVDYLIITTDAQRPGYDAYARCIKLAGYNTEVRTLSWIRQHYVGIDDAERMRRFIIEAVEKWGVLYVLMGGDASVVPTRYVWMAPIYNRWPVHTVTDLYYSDCDGTWNLDGDARFGEVEDSLDFYPDVFVGRLPTLDSIDIYAYAEKVDAYLRPKNPALFNNVLFFSSDFDVPDDAYLMALRLSDRLPSWMGKSYLNNRPLQDLKDSLYAGFGLIVGLGHGDINNIRVCTAPRENATNFFFDSLRNENRYGVMFVITCYTNTFQSNCLSKHWILNPCGGGIGYVGPTSFSEAYVHELFTAKQFDSLFSMPLSMSLGVSKIPYIPVVQSNNWYRLYEFAINLLGDPALSLWDSVPLSYATVDITPDTVNVGFDTVTITTDPPGPFRAILFKEGESYHQDSTLAGVLTTFVKTESSGYLQYTVLRDGYIAYTDSVFVMPSNPYCVYSEYRIVDSVGNGDGIANPGEDILLFVKLENTGSTGADSVDGRLVCGDSFVTVLVDTASFPSLSVGGDGENVTPFECVVSDVFPDEHTLDYEIVCTFAGGESRDSFQIIGAAPVVAHFTHECVWADDTTISIAPYVVNYGHAGADSVYGVVSVSSESLTVIDSTVTFPKIPINGVVGSNPDVFLLSVKYPWSTVRYNYRVYRGTHQVVDCEIIVDTLSKSNHVCAIGMKHSVILEWSPVNGAIGYRVYRGVSHGGPYSLLNNYCEHDCQFEDKNVSTGQGYYYYVCAVDQWMNEGISSDTVCGRVNPLFAEGWPQTVYDFLFSSPNFGDLDLFYPGLEIVVCGKGGNIYAWHSDGTPVKGDGVLVTIPSVEVWSSPALGDVNRDGALEIVFCVRSSANSIYVVNNQGVCLPGWPKSAGAILGSPVLADIDMDGDLEIFVWTQSADVYAFHHDGTGVFSLDGLLKDNPGNGYGTLAIGDINADDSLEVVCCGGSQSESLFVWNHSGEYSGPFPVAVQPERGLRYSVVLGDVCGDERLEMSFYADSTERVYLLDADGESMWSYVLSDVADVEGSPVIADITGDGRGEVICGYKAGFVILDSLGSPLMGFPDTLHDAKLPIVVDFDNNGIVEVGVGSIDWNLYAYDDHAQQVAGFPILFGNRLESSPAAYDIDDDGLLELMVSTNDYYFNVFDLEGKRAEWPRFRYDPYNSGMYKSGNLHGILDGRTYVQNATTWLNVEPTIFSYKLRITYNTVMGQRARLRIYDVVGRLLRDFSCAERGNAHAPCSITWYGDDEQGRRVSSGVYFVQYESGSEKLTTKVIKVH